MIIRRSGFGKPGINSLNIIRGIVAVILILGAVVAVWLLAVRPYQNSRKVLDEVNALWNKGDYQAAYTETSQKLESDPLNYRLLCINGFSAYQLGMSKITSKDKLSLIDQSIGSLRKALLCKEKYYAKYIDYILGKDYYAKGKGYEEETLRYLEAARDAYGSGTAASGGNGGAQTSDTPADLDEYLGLAYAAVHDYRSSVASFSKALDKTASGDADRLYMAIAKSYSALKDDATACSYLILCVNSTKDANTKIQARLRLGAIYQGEGKNDLAEAQYNAIITENGNNAEAYYQLGKIYAANGDSVKARYEWRRALTADPTHAGARQALGLA